jgi:hypothetical protein
VTPVAVPGIARRLRYSLRVQALFCVYTTIVNDPSIKKTASRTAQATPEAERRRMGTVVHDERGNASVRWRDAPADYERPVLEVLGNPKLTLKADDSYDPYARRPSRPGGNGKRTDLRKLSDWIKLTRELEERKSSAEAPDED